MSDKTSGSRAGSRSVLTFLFSDLEGSTSLLGSLGMDAYGELLVDHHRALAEVVVAYGGVVEVTEGDGALVIFDSASAGVAAALEVQLALASNRCRRARCHEYGWVSTAARPNGLTDSS